MSKRVVAVVVCTLLALVAACLWVPCNSMVMWGFAPEIEWHWVGSVDLWFDLLDDLESGATPKMFVLNRTALGIEVALILLLGGGLLTFVVRRERRREAAA